MSLKIHTFPNNPRANKALVAAEYAGVKVEVVNVELGKDNKTEQFLAMNPLGKVPTLETADGSIWESNAIARYVARQGDSKLFGSNDLEAGQVDQWIDWVRGDLELAGAVWLYPLYGLIPNNPQATEQAKEDIKKQLVMLDNHIATRSYLVGERISLADIVVACTLIPLYTNVFDVSYRETFPNVNRWFDNVVNQPNFKKVQGEVILATEMKVAPAWVPKEEEEKGNEDAAVDAAPAKKVKVRLNYTSFVIPIPALGTLFNGHNPSDMRLKRSKRMRPLRKRMMNITVIPVRTNPRNLVYLLTQLLLNFLSHPFSPIIPHEEVLVGCC